MTEKKGRKARTWNLALMTVLVAAFFGLALVMTGGQVYASQHPHPHPHPDQPSDPLLLSVTDPKIQIVKLDQDDNPVKGATMELWRLQIPNTYYYDETYYSSMLDQLADNEKTVGLVDRWVTDGERHVVDLSNYYPEDYSRWTEPYDFQSYDERYSNYEGGYPFFYMLIETDTPGNYMTAEKTFFRVDPDLDIYDGELYRYDIKYFANDPRKSGGNIGYPVPVTSMITAVDTKAPLLVDKLDQNGRYVKGAELELLDDKGNPVMGTDGKPVKWISSGKTDELWIKRPSFPDADATEHGGGPVKYTIREISAPEGYEKSKDVTFTLYPCGKWDYAKGSEPATGHKPTEETSTGNTGSQTPVVPSPCQPPPVVDPISPVTPSPGGTIIPYVYTDPIRVIDFKVNKENGVSKGDFTINKTDQDRQPLSEVAFAVYGKPKLTTTINVDVTKHWEYEGATTVTGSLGPDEHALGDEPEPQEQHVEQQQQESEEPQEPESQVQEQPVPQVQTDPVILEREGDEKSFPYDFMADLTPKVTIKDGSKEIGTMTGTPLKDILGDAFDKAQNNGEKTAGTYLSYTDSYYGKTTVQGIPHWYYKGSADEKLGTVSLKDGDSVVIGEELEGSLAGTTVKIEREKTYSGYDNDNEWTDNLKRIATYVDGTVNAGGIGALSGIRSLNIDQYNKFDRPIPTNILRHFSEYPIGRVVYGNLVRHIAPQPVLVEFTDGKLLLTDEKGTRDITDSCEVVVNNIVQWRTELGEVEMTPPPQQCQEKCPPKCK